MTPHINAKKEDISKIVLMAGDPLRAQLAAKTFLKEPKLVNTVRGMLAYTGYYNDRKITIMGHGMGLDSVAIYVHELYQFYDVETIIRLGSCGSYSKEIKCYDIILAEEAFTQSNFGLGYEYDKPSVKHSGDILDKVVKYLKDKDHKNYHVGNVNSSTWFYTSSDQLSNEFVKENKLIGVEMESYALYLIAKYFNRKAFTILTVSDNLVTNEQTSPLERQTKFLGMFEIILNSGI